MSTKNKILIVFLIIIFFTALVYRLYGLSIHNPPFWVDEFSTAKQANLILKYGFSVFTNPSLTFEPHNFTTYFLVAGFFKLFGQNEWAARMPFVLIGSLVPLMVFILARKIYDTKTAIAAALLTTFSYFEITWSRQARAYVLVQLLILAAVFFYLKLQEKNRRVAVYLPLLALTILAGILTHALFLIFLAAFFLDIIIFHREILKTAAKRLFSYILLILILGLSYKTGLLTSVLQSLTSNPIKANNLWYYHSFLWREYGLFSFLALIGFLISLFTKKKEIILIIIYVIFHLLFIFFFFSPYVSRYLLPIFPFIFIAVSYSITYLSNLFLIQQKITPNSYIYKVFSYLIPLILIFFIILNGYKFTIKPKQFYSVNHDFREIALIDYNSVYNIIKNKGNLSQGKTAIIDTWLDRMYWYVDKGYPALYMFRWINESGTINGLPKKTDFKYNSEKEKVIPHQENLRFIGELSDLKKAMKKYPKGFIFIDDSSLPRDVIDYAEKNFKKELYLDHYPLDDNPYSIWPATLYSWGIN